MRKVLLIALFLSLALACIKRPLNTTTYIYEEPYSNQPVYYQPYPIIVYTQPVINNTIIMKHPKHPKQPKIPKRAEPLPVKPK